MSHHQHSRNEPIHTAVEAAIKVANDDNGDRSQEVIDRLEGQGYKFLGNPDFVEEYPPMAGYLLTEPWI